MDTALVLPLNLRLASALLRLDGGRHPRGRRKDFGILQRLCPREFWRSHSNGPLGTTPPNSTASQVRLHRTLLPAVAVDVDGDALRDFDSDEGDVYEAWTSFESSALYHVGGWGAPYFLVNNEGDVAVRPNGSEDGSDEIDIVQLIGALRKRNISLPMIIRFPEIIQHRMNQLQGCFDSAIQRFGYQGTFRGVFPVKSNQDRYVVEDIITYGRQYGFGLEAGSKPELLIAIASLRDNEEALLVCNGYKDEIYMESVLLARQLGQNAILVLEQIEELDLLIRVSQRLGVRPVIGVRAKLSTRHSGHWGDTSGDTGKFGLTMPEVVRVVYQLRKEGMLDCLQLLHFHIGSQIPSISIIKEAMREASNLYCELALMGAPMGHIDCGGGLGIDYDGNKSYMAGSSTNYTMQNYANDVVAAVMDACVLKGVAQPIITTESGRSLASHHAVVVFDVLNATDMSEEAALKNLEALRENHAAGLGHYTGEQSQPQNKTNGAVSMAQPALRVQRSRSELGAGEYMLSTFVQVYQTMDKDNFQEALNDAKQFKAEAASLFKLGCLSLEQRAQADSLYSVVCHRVLSFTRDSSGKAEELDMLTKAMASVYHINLSVFRSAVDSWAIGQLFPIMPLHRLDEEPNVHCTLADLTCDSDGRFNKFISSSSASPSPTLPVHRLRKGEPYYLGMFLGGVYQEVMGSIHNLFGALNVVVVRSKASAAADDCSTNGRRAHGRPNGSLLPYIIEHIVRGQTMEDVLESVQHEGEDLVENLRRQTEEAVEDGRLSLEEASTLLTNYQKCLCSYTYLKSNPC